MTNDRNHTNNVHTDESEAWVRAVLDPDQLSSAKKRMGRLALTGKTVLLLWGLRVYLVLMISLIAFQIWNALRA